MSQRVSISVKDQKLIWGFSAARCSSPDCRILCIAQSTGNDPHATIGEIAHICAANDDGPRANSELSARERNSYDNLILLCANCHAKIDGQPETYTVDMLKGWKQDHEEWVDEKLRDHIAEISFSELDIITKAILAVPVEPTENLQLISPREKINKNNLSEKIAQRIRIGMLKVKEVENFIKDASKLTTNFPEQLTNGFVVKYKELREGGMQGDSLFEEMHDFASAKSSDFDQRSAGLAVLVYLFEKCEVFEK